MLEKGGRPAARIIPADGGRPGGILASMVEVTSTFVRAGAMALASPRREGLAAA